MYLLRVQQKHLQVNTLNLIRYRILLMESQCISPAIYEQFRRHLKAHGLEITAHCE